MEVKKGDIYYADLRPVIGSEQGGIRPVLIIQNNRGNRFSPTVLVAAITSRTGKADIPTHVFLEKDWKGIRKDSVVMLEQLRTLAPELVVVAAYGRVLPDEMLALPPKGCINVHSSLLPKYRGSAPIHWAVVNGDKETGVTIMHMAHELDAGDIIAQVRTPIGPEETVGQVHDRLAQLGGELLVQVVADIAAGTAQRTPQDPDQVTYAPMLSRALSPIDWSMSAKAIHDKIRGLDPWPATSTDILTGQPVKVFASRLTGQNTAKTPGTVLAAGKDGIDVSCGDGAVLRILELQAPGSRRMAAADYLRGHPIHID